ncbi:uncharacterized protein LOC108034503 [Drosophila biarmipes]|uniref:uncharacterized protein LOC108034503 n=1 Tax=Drosophila biarmipes TaxID=125945 RepID=UPI0007E849FA|nr:uncharacterized protein LOC108034503 [Drosophila biarmipes]XP_043949999.1 uncharacterized protein LOC108034503 [Drosophila biarmipes]XP_050741575.1 uncharacterized protein LOC108034503 [Drosophila biarmipes]
MDENGKCLLNDHCVLAIMNYLIADCQAKPETGQDKSVGYDDLINFALAHESFVGALETYHNCLYKDLELALVCRITKLRIDLLFNKDPNKGNAIFWRSYLQSINERSPFNVELTFDHANVAIAIKGISPGLGKTEKLKLSVNITAEILGDILRMNPNLSKLALEDTGGNSTEYATTERFNITTKTLGDLLHISPKIKKLAFESSIIHGSLSDIIPLCTSLAELRIKINAEVVGDKLELIAKLRNLRKVIITGIYESGLELRFFNNFGIWHRPKSFPPLTLTIEGCLTDIGKPVNIATLRSLSHLRIYDSYEYNPRDYVFGWLSRNVKGNPVINAEYEVSEMSEECNSIQETIASITLGRYVEVKFDRNEGELQVEIHRQSDISRMGNLAKLPNLSGLIIQNKCRESDYPNSLAKFLRCMAPKGSFALKSCEINDEAIDQLECREIAKIETLQYLKCHLAEWNLIPILTHLPNLQHVMIEIPDRFDSDISWMVYDLLTACHVQASIIAKDFVTNYMKNEKKLAILKSSSSLDRLLKAFAPFSQVKELDISGIRIENVYKVAEIQSISTLKCNLSNTIGVENLADLNKLKTLEIYPSDERFPFRQNLSELFKKLAEKNVIEYIRTDDLGSEEILNVSRIKSLKKLWCHITEPEDLRSLSKLAGSNLEELTFSVSAPKHFLQNVLVAFSTNDKTALHLINVCKRDITEKTEIFKMKCLKSLTINIKFLNVAELYSLSSLQNLDLCNKIGYDDIKRIAELDKLQSLDCSLLNEPGLQALANIINLKKLTIRDSEGSLTELFRAFARNSDSKLQELETPIVCSDEISEISKIKSLITLNIENKGMGNNFSDLGQLSELKSLRISEISEHDRDFRFKISDECRIDITSVLPIFQTCQKLDCVTLHFGHKGNVSINFVSEVHDILKSVRDPALQRPLKLCISLERVFPKFHLDTIDEAYLSVRYSYKLDDTFDSINRSPPFLDSLLEFE